MRGLSQGTNLPDGPAPPTTVPGQIRGVPSTSTVSRPPRPFPGRRRRTRLVLQSLAPVADPGRHPGTASVRVPVVRPVQRPAGPDIDPGRVREDALMALTSLWIAV